MNERLRMQYLDAMGIDSFVPRFILPQAKAAVHCPLPDIADIPEASAEAPGTASVATQSEAIADIVTAITSPKAAEQSRPLATAPATAPQPPEPVVEKPVEAPVQFSLALWSVAGFVQVIDSHRAGDALPTPALLANILQAVRGQKVALPKAEIVHWPMVDNGQDQGWSAATQMIQGFLEGRLIHNPVPHLWLLGEAATYAVLGHAEPYPSALFQSRDLPMGGAKGLVLPSLAELLYQPELKKPTWLALCESMVASP